MDLMGSLLLFPKTVLPFLHLVWSNPFNSVYRLLPFLIAGSLSTFSLSLKKVTVLILQTTVLMLWSPACPVFESFLNRKILKHLSLHNLSDRQYGFRQGRSAGDLQAFLTESWSSAFRDFGEIFAVARDTPKIIDSVRTQLWYRNWRHKIYILLSVTLSQD